MLMDLQISLNKESEKEYNVRITLTDFESKKYSTTFKEKLTSKYLYTSSFKNIKRWDIDNPFLYDVLVELLDEENVIDAYKTRIGFRTATFTPEGFLLNNKPVKLIGLNRHQSYPYVGYAMPKSIQELDADILKEYGCNIVRTSHYMQSDHFLNRCDELGLLVLEEIPGWQYIGNDHFKELTYQNITDMINNHFNHPSVVTWGVRINESKDDHDFYTKTNELARTLDSSRQTCGIRNTKKGDMLEDIYTYNDFSHVGDNIGLEPVKKVVPGYKPYLVTEHNGHVFPTKKNDTEARRKSQALRHTEVLDSIYSDKRYSGAIGWCLADYNTHIQFGSNDHICHHGVMDMFRIPKYAAYTYRAQKEDEILLFVASNMISGDFEEFLLPETVVFTNCDYIKVYKNDLFIGVFEPNYDEFSNLPYPPIIFDDYIGDIIVNSGEFKEKDARGITSILNAFYHYGFNVPLRTKLKYLNLRRKGVITYDTLVRQHELHLAHQSKKPIVFKFEGYIDDELVLTEKRGHTKEAKLIAKLDHSKLEHGFTYDATRVVVSLKDEFNYDLTYANDVIEVEVSKHLELVGPNKLALIGGSNAFYVKTKGVAGTGTIKITSTRNQEIELKVDIKKGTLS